jgi:hypothetical protein
LAQNPNRLAFGFTENVNLQQKSDRNSVFLGRKAHIPNRLHIMVPYISFNVFLKIQILAQNLNGLAFGFTKKRKFVAKID